MSVLRIQGPHGWAPADIPARTAISPNKRFLLRLQTTKRVAVDPRAMFRND
jgi:hypothetical protein